ncbi:MAG: hypothetical protein JWN04_5412 [Myxococcaceae bacterium]|nr:hypothetical protein [Myxococcaceae bacterium]
MCASYNRIYEGGKFRTYVLGNPALWPPAPRALYVPALLAGRLVDKVARWLPTQVNGLRFCPLDDGDRTPRAAKGAKASGPARTSRCPPVAETRIQQRRGKTDGLMRAGARVVWFSPSAASQLVARVRYAAGAQDAVSWCEVEWVRSYADG